MRPGLVPGVALAAVVAGGVSAQASVRPRAGLAFDMRVERSPRRSPATGGAGSPGATRPRARCRIRLHFRVLRPDSSSWQIRVGDLGTATLQTIRGQASAGTAWTDKRARAR
jgi:hypothetical protein